MIRLFDLGAEFWRNYYATGSAIRAYDLTLEKIDWYWRDSKRMVVCCDSPESKRREIDPEYKAGRRPKPADAIDALQSVEHRVQTWGCPVSRVDGYEADDVIATLTKQAYPEDVVIIGDEKDLYALIADDIRTVRLWGKKGLIGYAECYDKWGVTPDQITDFLALCGDAADNIKGCENMGPMRAATLLERFGDIATAKQATEGHLLELPKFGKKTVASFLEWDPTQALSLVRLHADLPVNLFDLIPDIEQ